MTTLPDVTINVDGRPVSERLVVVDPMGVDFRLVSQSLYQLLGALSLGLCHPPTQEELTAQALTTKAGALPVLSCLCMAAFLKWRPLFRVFSLCLCLVVSCIAAS